MQLAKMISDAEMWSIVIASVLMLLDIIAGIAKGASKNMISSSIMRSGLWHKFGFICAISLAFVLDVAQQHIDLGFSIPVLSAVTLYISLTEIASILENIREISPELDNSSFMKIFQNNSDNDIDIKKEDDTEHEKVTSKDVTSKDVTSEK